MQPALSYKSPFFVIHFLALMGLRSMHSHYYLRPWVVMVAILMMGNTTNAYESTLVCYLEAAMSL